MTTPEPRWGNKTRKTRSLNTAGAQFQVCWGTQHTSMLFLKVKMNMSWNNRKVTWKDDKITLPPCLASVRVLLNCLCLVYSSTAPILNPEGDGKIFQLPKSNQRQRGKIDLPSSVFMGKIVCHFIKQLKLHFCLRTFEVIKQIFTHFHSSFLCWDQSPFSSHPLCSPKGLESQFGEKMYFLFVTTVSKNLFTDNWKFAPSLWNVSCSSSQFKL